MSQITEGFKCPTGLAECVKQGCRYYGLGNVCKYERIQEQEKRKRIREAEELVRVSDAPLVGKNR